MARILTGSIVSDIRGSIGGTTFQRSTHGLIAKNKTSAVNFNTSQQASVRNLLTQLQFAWQNLSSSQRIQWQTWADYQNLKVKNFSSTGFYGQEAFIQANFYAVLTGLPIKSDPVFTPISLPLISINIFNDTVHLLIDTGIGNDHSLFRPVIRFSSPQLASRNVPVGQQKFCKCVSFNTQYWDASSMYVQTFGKLPQAGAILFCLIGLIQVDNYTLTAFTKQQIIVQST